MPTIYLCLHRYYHSLLSRRGYTLNLSVIGYIYDWCPSTTLIEDESRGSGTEDWLVPAEFLLIYNRMVPAKYEKEVPVV